VGDRRAVVAAHAQDTQQLAVFCQSEELRQRRRRPHEAVIQQRDAGLAGERDLVLEQLAGGLVGLGCGRGKVPRPRWRRTRPWRSSRSIALRIVTRETPKASARSSSLGIETPTG